MPVEFEYDGQRFRTFVKNFDKQIRKTLLDEMNRQSELQTTHIIRRHLTGGTSKDKLGVRSGQLRRTTRKIKAVMGNTEISGGTKFGVEYARVHIGRKGRVTTIRGKPWLKIPLDAAKTPAGNIKSRFSGKGKTPGTFIRKSKAGNLIIFGTRGKKLIPLFVLKESVKIKTRVHPEVIHKLRRPGVLKDFGKVIDSVIDKSMAS